MMNRLILALSFLCIGYSGWGMEPLKLTPERTTELFLQKNLSLLIEKYNIDMAEAEVIQSKIWDNPSLSVEQILYNPESKNFFGVGEPQFEIEIEQVITLAGKRRKGRELAELEAKDSEFEYYDLIRNLKFELNQTYYDIENQMASIAVYEQQVERMRKLIEVMEVQYNNGNVSLNDLVRMKSFVFGLESDNNELKAELLASRQELYLLTGIGVNEPIELITGTVPVGDFNNYRAVDLLETAKSHRMDFKGMNNQIAASEKAHELARAERWTDLSVGATYDHAAGLVPNYVGVTVGIDLPLWNQNKGNIKAAEVRKLQAETELEYAGMELHGEVVTTLTKAQQIKSLYDSYAGTFQETNDQLYQGLMKNYMSRDISLYELIDFFESYNETMILLNELRANYNIARAELNFVVGTEMF